MYVFHRQSGNMYKMFKCRTIFVTTEKSNRHGKNQVNRLAHQHHKHCATMTKDEVRYGRVLVENCS